MINRFKLICVAFFIWILSCTTIIGLEYHAEADFSDIFKGYEKNASKSKLIDPLITDDLGEISELIRLNQMTFDEIRTLSICEKDDEYTSIPNSGKMIASAFLSKVCFLFYYNVEGSDKFVVVDALGGGNLNVNQCDSDSFAKEKMMLTSYSVYNVPEIKEETLKTWVSVINQDCYEKKELTDEQKHFILSIRQAVFKIASNPVGRRLFCRMLNKINDKKILILQTKHNANNGSFSFHKKLTDNLAGRYVCVTVPWELGKSTNERPGAGVVRTKTYKQLSVRVCDGTADDMKIIGRQSSKVEFDGFDEKPFYISLTHEFIHCLHYLESTIVNLSESDANKIMFSAIYRKYFWEKNADSIFQDISFHYLFNDNKKTCFSIDNYEKMCEHINETLTGGIAKQQNDIDKKTKLSIIVDSLSLWSMTTDQCVPVINALYLALYDDIVYEGINTLLLKHVLQSIINHNDEWFSQQATRYSCSVESIKAKEANYKLMQSILKSIASRYFISVLSDSCYYRDYTNGEEIYAVTGLRYDETNNVFVIDNVSELSFNALEKNDIVRISYNSDCELSSTNDDVLNRIKSRFSQLVTDGQAQVSTQLLKLLTGTVRFDRLKTGEKLDEALCSKLCVKESYDIFDGI